MRNNETHTTKGTMMKAPAPSKKSASDTYDKLEAELLDIVDRIRVGIGHNSFGVDHVTWANVGDLGSYRASLVEVLNQIEKTGEYTK